MRGAALLLLCILPLGLFAQDEDLYRQGLQAFQGRNYNQALDHFRNLSRQTDHPLAGDGLFWTAKTLLGLEDLEGAALELDQFLAFYPESRYFEEAHYLRGRIFFLSGQYETSLEYFLNFSLDFSNSPYAANSLYWIAESLFQLGQIERAQAAFQQIVRDYPESYKVEAARYRLSLIDLSAREQKLMELLRWSHEEFLRSNQESLESQLEYQEALEAYQRQIVDLTAQERLYRNQLAVLELKSRALELKEFYLEELSRLEQ